MTFVTFDGEVLQENISLINISDFWFDQARFQIDVGFTLTWIENASSLDQFRMKLYELTENENFKMINKNNIELQSCNQIIIGKEFKFTLLESVYRTVQKVFFSVLLISVFFFQLGFEIRMR